MGRAVFTGRITLSGHVLPKIDPLMIAQGRTTIALFVLAPLLLLRNRQAFRVRGSHLLQFLPLGILGLAASNYFYYLAIERTTVATAIVLQYVAPVWVLLYMVARKLQRPTAERVVGVVLAVVGCAFAVGALSGRAGFPWFGLSGVHFSTVGVLAAELAAVSFAFYNIYAQHLLQAYSRWTVLIYALFWSAAFWIVVNPPWKIAAQHYSSGQWVFLTLFSMTSMLVPFSFYFAGLQHLDPTRAVVTSCLEPVFAILITAVLLGEWVSPIQVVGMLIVLAATVLVQRPDRAHHEPTIAVEPIE
jgi:drug/metabolite transporter (DMT)-like permease